MTYEQQKQKGIEEQVDMVALILGARNHQNYDDRFRIILDFADSIRDTVLEETVNEVQKIIEKSNATFFVNKDEKDVEIPTDEVLYELKATISDNISMYFCNLKNLK